MKSQCRTAARVAVLFLFAGLPAVAQDAAPTYQAAQAERGKPVYEAQCAMCHGDELDNGEFAVALKGETFGKRWGGRSLDQIYDFMSQMMPAADPGSLSPDTYADILSYVLQENGVKPGDKPLPTDDTALKAMIIPK